MTVPRFPGAIMRRRNGRGCVGRDQYMTARFEVDAGDGAEVGTSELDVCDILLRVSARVASRP